MATNSPTRHPADNHGQKSLKAHPESPQLDAHKEAQQLAAHDPEEDTIVPAATADTDEIPKAAQYGAAILLGLIFGVGCYIWVDSNYSFHRHADNIKTASATESSSLPEAVLPAGMAYTQIPDPFEALSVPSSDMMETDEEMPTASADAASMQTTPVVYLFRYNSTEIPENAALTYIARKAAREGLGLDVTAYTDEHGHPEYNRRLSMRRAKAVGDYLVAHGAQAGKVSVHGMGPTHAYANDAQNRRAEIVIVR